MANYIGIDGCRMGWFYFRLTDSDKWSFGVLNNIAEVESTFKPNDKILIDIPIGLRHSEDKERLCDLESRKILKKRGSSVFPAPSRLALQSDNYVDASRVNLENLGRRLTKQSWAIMRKIKEVDDFVRSEPDIKLREMHPECTYWALNSKKPLSFKKKSRDGLIERLLILKKFFTMTDKVYIESMNSFLRKEVAKDDILDALTGAVSLKFSKKLITLPAIPERDAEGIKMQIVIPEL